ncbi:hypothetical protein [Streptosporangium roseum]|uniref:hypothetical protein n=1 Tax=Streptosporangium roseum TaxID=2001 RepID=UPI0012DDD7EF|nr:hypothetical protein [Streptosporangium roseum]
MVELTGACDDPERLVSDVPGEGVAELPGLEGPGHPLTLGIAEVVLADACLTLKAAGRL